MYSRLFYVFREEIHQFQGIWNGCFFKREADFLRVRGPPPIQLHVDPRV